MRKPIRLFICASATALMLGAAPIGPVITSSEAQVVASITAGVAPPLLPVYVQPPIPGPGYVWIPGYWAWDGQEYYWVPGYWATPPAANLLWTPPYWAWNDGVYDFYPGYWGPTVGFYGGIDYGFGYTGVGYEGGYWRNNQFFYNTAVNNLAGVQIANTYNQAVPAAANHVSFNGGSGGTTVKATEAQIAARAHTRPPTAEQIQHQQMAGREPGLRFNSNHGRPPTMAMRRANEFHGQGAAAAAHPGPTAAHAGPRLGATMPRTAQHAHAAGRNFAYHAGAMHGPAAREHFAYHAPAMHAPMAQRFTHASPMHMGGHALRRGSALRRHAYGRAPAFRRAPRISAACTWAAAPRTSAACTWADAAALRRRPARRRRSARRPPRPVIGLPAPVIAAGAGVGRSSPRRSDDTARRRPIRR